MNSDRYLDVEIPPRFVLEFMTPQGTWMDWGLYTADAVKRLDDGSYVCLSDGVPIYIRCVARHADRLVVVAGTGERLTYRLRPYREPLPGD